MRTKFWIVRIPDDVWAPFWEGVLILVVAISAWAAGHPWLFSSLGPTAYELAEKPHLKSARLYNVVVGHLVGLGCGLIALAIIGAAGTPKVSASSFVPMARLGASVIGVVATTFINLELDSGQPASLATCLLITLGSYDTARGALWIVIGVLILAAIGGTGAPPAPGQTTTAVRTQIAVWRHSEESRVYHRVVRPAPAFHHTMPVAYTISFYDL